MEDIKLPIARHTGHYGSESPEDLCKWVEWKITRNKNYLIES